MVYKWFYKTPNGFDNILMNSDEYLIGLRFINSKDILKHYIEFEEKIYQYLKKQVNG